MKRKPKILQVDLTARAVDSVDLDEATLRKYLGGSGLASRMIWEETEAETKPLSEENRLIFAIGLLTGTAAPSSSRYVVSGLSPLTGIWGEAHGGGTWGHALSRTPYLAIEVRGKAEKPVYLSIDGDRAELKDASHVWGKDTYETHDQLKEESGGQASVLTIGPAGERLIKYAAIMSDGAAARAAARCGLGAVMGYKNLKAIAVRGGSAPDVENQEQLKASVGKHFPKVVYREASYIAKQDETWTHHANKRGCIKNWTQSEFPGFGEKLAEMGRKGEGFFYCTGCRTSCMLSVMYQGHRHFHGEFTLPFGANCLIDDMEALVEAEQLCNRYGLDQQSAGHVIAFAMELYDRGIITKKDTGGIEMEWGNAPAMLRLLKKILERRGLGRLLGEGVRAAAEKIGGRAAEYAIHVKGMELPLYDPRCHNAHALEYATASRGGDHLEGLIGLHGQRLSAKYDYIIGKHYLTDETALAAAGEPFAVAGQGKVVAWAQNLGGIFDGLNICKLLGMPQSWVREPEAEGFNGVNPDHLLEWLNLATGWDMDLPELMTTGERIFNLKRMINVRKGISRKDDTLPLRFLTRKRGGKGQEAENLPPLGVMLNEYYLARGWSEEGVPTRQKLDDLGLEDVAVPGQDRLTPPR